MQTARRERTAMGALVAARLITTVWIALGGGAA
jgi:hypothetical protein